MKKLILTIAALAVVGTPMLAGSADASAGGWRRRRAPVTCAPAPPATVAQSQAGTGYRTYSYQPVAPAIRSYSAPKKWPWEYPKTDSRRYGGN